MKTIYSSDTHYFHKNIIGYSGRPFRKLDGQPDVESMNEELIRRHNAVVAPDDIFVHIGDFALGKSYEGESVVKRLNGYKVIVIGNHDRSPKSLLSWGFDEVHKQLDLIDGGRKLFLRHAPPKEAYTGDHTGKTAQHFGYEADYFLHGHVHKLWKRRGPFINVGVDVRDFYPRTLDELLAE